MKHRALFRIARVGEPLYELLRHPRWSIVLLIFFRDGSRREFCFLSGIRGSRDSRGLGIHVIDFTLVYLVSVFDVICSDTRSGDAWK